MKPSKTYKNNYEFIDSALVNDATYFDYLERLKKVALSMFEWVNLPESMNARWLERTLYYKGQAALLKDEKYGFINTGAASGGNINIYGLPTAINCYAFSYQKTRRLFSGLNPANEKQKETECVLVLNNWERIPTAQTLELFALRLYEAEQTAFVNIKAQKTPVLVLCDEKQRLSMINMYKKYDGNEPVIYGDNQLVDKSKIESVKTEAPFIADKIMSYKKAIWNEALEFLGINTIIDEKKERLITDEANSNNELINLNLQSYLAPRLEACRQFNELFGLTGTDKEISVRVRSDLRNVIKDALSSANDYLEESNFTNEEITIKENENKKVSKKKKVNKKEGEENE